MGIETAALMAATAGATTAAGTAAVALPWLSTTAALGSVAAAGGTAGTIAGIGSSLAGLSSVLSIGSGLSSILGGFQANAAAKGQASLANETARLQALESDRQTSREVALRKEAADTLARQQKLMYLKSGVSLAGSPLLVMEESRKNSTGDINEILSAGRATKDALATEGRVRASQIKSSGRDALISGLTKGLQAFA